MYSCHLILISSASVRSIQFVSFIVPIFAWNVPLVSNFLEEISSLSHSICFPLFLCIDHLGRLSYPSFIFFGTLHSDGYIFPFLLCLSLFFSILRYNTKYKTRGIHQNKNKQWVDCLYKRAGKLLLEFILPGNRAVLAKERSRHGFWWILITATQKQAQMKPGFRVPMAAAGACNRESFGKFSYVFWTEELA